MIIRARPGLNGWSDLLQGILGQASNKYLGGSQNGGSSSAPIIVQIPAPVAPPPVRQGISTGAVVGIAAVALVAVFLLK